MTRLNNTSLADDVRCSVLHRHFPNVVPLLTIILDRFGIDVSASSSKRPCSLSKEQWLRLSGTLICTDQLSHISSPPPIANEGSRSQPNSQQHMTIHEAVQEAQLQILSLASTRGLTKQEGSTNVLLKGYRRPDDRLESFRVTSTGRPGLINLYPNSMVTSLVLGKEWHHVFDKIGAERFVWLLVHTSIFVPLLEGGADGSCFVQLTGAALSESKGAVLAGDDAVNVPVTEVNGPKRKHSAQDQQLQSMQAVALGKRARPFERVDSRFSVRSTTSGPDFEAPTGHRSTRAAAGKSATVDRKPSEIVIVRSRMFYARCSRNQAGRVEVGLPSVHVLPRSANPKELDKALPSSSSSQSSSSNTLARGKSAPPIDIKRGGKSHEAIYHERRTRHFSKYVFPRQFRSA